MYDSHKGFHFGFQRGHMWKLKFRFKSDQMWKIITNMNRVSKCKFCNRKKKPLGKGYLKNTTINKNKNKKNVFYSVKSQKRGIDIDDKVLRYCNKPGVNSLKIILPAGNTAARGNQ